MTMGPAARVRWPGATGPHGLLAATGSQEGRGGVPPLTPSQALLPATDRMMSPGLPFPPLTLPAVVALGWGLFSLPSVPPAPASGQVLNTCRARQRQEREVPAPGQHSEQVRMCVTTSLTPWRQPHPISSKTSSKAQGHSCPRSSLSPQ